jgi:hypothetical protein
MAIKMSVGGKYAGVKREPNPNTAGDVTKGSGGGQSVKREFIGSGVNSYTFTRVVNGITRTLVVRAHSVKEANTLAATRGYKTTDREIKRRRSNSRRR